jgi:hypothetical protein
MDNQIKNELNYTIEDGVIHLKKLKNIDLDIVPFKGRNGIYLSIRSQDIIDISKSILLIEDISLANLLKDYEAKVNEKLAQETPQKENKKE